MIQTKNIFIALTITATFAIPAFGASELATVQKQLTAQKAATAAATAAVKKSDSAVKKTQNDLVSATKRVTTTTAQLNASRARVAALDKQRDDLTAKIAANRERLSDAAAGILAMSMQPANNMDSAENYVLSSALLAGVADQFDAEMKIAAAQIIDLERVLKERTAEVEKLTATSKKYNAQKNQLDKLLRTRTEQNANLRETQYAAQKKLRELSARAKNLADLSAGVGSSAITADTSFSRHRLNPPVSGRLVVQFGEKSAVGLASDGWRIITDGGAMVAAPADGVVKFADAFRGYSRVVIISHKNGYNSVMAGMDSTNVMIGQSVLAGEPIGQMPDSGRGGGRPELYLEVRRGAAAVDPGRLFNKP